MNIIDFIAKYITEDPCVFNEEVPGVPTAAPSNADINAAAETATGLKGDAKETVAADMRAQEEQKRKEAKARADALNPLLDRTKEKLVRATDNLERASTNTTANIDYIKDSKTNVNEINDMMQAIAKAATGGY